MSTYELQEKLKQLEKEIQELLEEQNHYLRILIKRKQELSNSEELEKTPICISEYVRKHIYSLSNKEDSLTKEQLEKRIEEAINYVCSCR